MGGSILVYVAIGLVIAYFNAKEFEKIAAMKGHTEKRYFWWTFLFGLFGMPMVIALPDRGNVAAQTKGQAIDELPDL